jgi:conjugal transfer/entry exclusion protein
MRVQAGVVGNIDTNRAEMSALVGQSQNATGAFRRHRRAISFSRSSRSSFPT